MAMIIPGDGADRTTGIQAEAAQRICQPASARSALGIGVAKNDAVGFTRGNLGIAKLRRRVLDDGGYQQWPIHHQSRLQH